MKTKLIIAGAAVALLALGGCITRESQREQIEVRRQDRGAAIDCWAYGQPTYSGISTGAITYDEGGRLSFIDAASGRLTVLEGECRVVYAAG